MKVFSVIGVSKSGKTTTIEKILTELKRRGYSAGTVKEIHYHDFKIDAAGTNTDRHRAAGADPVTARGERETDIMYGKKLNINEILKHYDCDYTVLEGVRDISAPKIITAHDTEEIKERFDKTVFMVSGRVSEAIESYGEIPAINALTDIEKLVDLIEEKVIDYIPYSEDISLKIGGKDISMVPFVQKIIMNSIKGVVSELEGYTAGESIEICIKRKD